MGAAAAPGSRAPVGVPGTAEGGSWLLGHAHRRRCPRRLTGDGAPVADGLDERAREVQHDEAKAVVHVAAAVEAWSGEDAATARLASRPWWTAAWERGERERERWEVEGVSGSGGSASGVHQEERRGAGARGSKARQWWGALWCMVDTKSFHRVRGVRCCARLGVRFRHIRCRFGPWRL